MSESHLMSPLLKGVSYLSSSKRVYIQHLAKACASVPVRFTEDLQDVSGKTLFNRDELMQPTAVFRLMQIPFEKVLTPIVTFESDRNLSKDFQSLIEQDSLLLAIDDNHSIEKLLEPLIEVLLVYPVLIQHLFLMAIQLPQTYSRTLYCSILSVLMAKEMRLSKADMESVFLASLGHDLGMLFVEPAVLNKKDKLNAEDWFQIQQHLPMSVEILNAIGNFNSAAITAVQEHHERCDGTGYPYAKVESEISLLGQVLGLTDSLAAIYFNRFKNEGRSLRDAAAIIQLNQQAYMHRNYELVMAILKRGDMPLQKIINENSPALIEEFTRKNKFMATWFNLLSDCLLSVGFTHGDRKLHALQNVIIHVATTIRGSGIFYESDGRKIESSTQVATYDDSKNIENMMMLQQEFLFHLQRLNRMFQIYLDSNEEKNKDLETKLRVGFEKILGLLNG
jgi:HD-GYP domain-containing protein (c-di-GMP phosphodiesterase class II)